MLARLSVLLPFTFTVPEGEQFPIFEYLDDGYKVSALPPGRSDRLQPIDGPDQITIDGKIAFEADVLGIDFVKDSFDRRKGSECDPPQELIRRAINSLLTRLRHVTRAGPVKPLNFPSVTWRLQYLKDDETELTKDEALIRGRGTLQFSMGWITVNRKVWEDVHSLPPEYDSPAWESLLLDAQTELPSIGPALVLAATAIEVFISQVLDRLAVLKAF